MQRRWGTAALSPARVVRSRGAFGRDYVAVTTTSGLWLRWEQYDVLPVAAKSGRGLLANGAEDFTVQVGIRPTRRWYGLQSETGFEAPYDATLGDSFEWSSQALPCFGEVPHGALFPGSIQGMDFKLTSMSAVLERADGRLRSPEAGVRLWPTGFSLLDDAIGGGFRAGSLNLLGGPQGQGKTMFALQAARAAVKQGRSAVFFSYELEADALVQRLVAMEAGELDPYDAPDLSTIRSIFEGTDGGSGGLIERMATTSTGTEALLRVSE